MSSWVDVVTLVSTQLQYVAPTFTGKKYITQNDSPPRYVVVPMRETYSAPGAIGGNPRLLYNAHVELAWHCWGVDYPTTARLIQALATAMRLALGTGSSPNGGLGSGAASLKLGETQWVEPEWATAGVVAVVPTILVLGVPEAALPTAPAVPVSDNTIPTVVVTQGAFDPTGASNFDGILQPGEG